jgi:ubiquitin-like 1-activating enzyme E1 B
MAGNIIPAIATTNAIISGLIVLQALHILRQAYDRLRNVHIQINPIVPLSVVTLSGPNPHCGVCRDAYSLLRCDPARATLGDVLEAVLAGTRWGGDGTDAEVEAEADVEMDGARAVCAFEGSRLLSDPDFDDNLGRTLESLGVGRGTFLSIQDEDNVYQPISLAIALLPCVFST